MAFVKSEEPFPKKRIEELRNFARDTYNDLEITLAIMDECNMKKLAVDGAISIKTVATASRAAKKFHDAALLEKVRSEMKKRVN